MSSEKYLHDQIDHGFACRNWLLVLLSLFFVVRLLFFTEDVVGHYPLSSLSPNVAQYLQYRGWFVLSGLLVYFCSYYFDWSFDLVAFAFFEIAVSNFILDVVHVYRFMHGSVSSMVIFLGVLRLVVVVCLLLNSLNAHRAPPQRRWLSRKNGSSSEVFDSAF